LQQIEQNKYPFPNFNGRHNSDVKIRPQSVSSEKVNASGIEGQVNISRPRQDSFFNSNGKNQSHYIPSHRQSSKSLQTHIRNTLSNHDWRQSSTKVLPLKEGSLLPLCSARLTGRYELMEKAIIMLRNKCDIYDRRIAHLELQMLKQSIQNQNLTEARDE
jgi:hypothetical protein